MKVSRRTVGLLVAAAILNLVAGSLYALSVLLAGLEKGLGLGSSSAAVGFSVATGAFMVGVLTAPWLLARLAIPTYVLAAGMAAVIAQIAAGTHADSTLLLALALAIYGWACGSFYSCALVSVKHSAVRSTGMAVGLVVAAFALGAVIWSYVFAMMITRLAAGSVFLAMAGIFAVASAVCVSLLWNEGRQPQQLSGRLHLRDLIQPRFLVLWFGFLALSLAGLAAISQAAPLANGIHGITPAALAALIAMANGGGRLLGGWVADRCPLKGVLVVLPLFAGLTLAGVYGQDGPILAMAVVLAALLYGVAAAVYPSVVMKGTSVEEFPLRFSALFVAWGIAAVAAAPLVVVLASAGRGYGIAFTAIGVLCLMICAGTVVAIGRAKF